MHTLTRTGIALVVCTLAIGSASPVLAQAVGRVTGTVMDSAGVPIPGVKIVLTSPEMRTFRLEKETNSKGKYKIAVADGTVTYDVRLEKEGYLTLVDRVKASLGGIATRNFTMLKPSEVQPAEAAPAGDGTAPGGAGPGGVDRVTMVFNEGVNAQAAGDLDRAAERFREASHLDPTLAAPLTGLASVALQRNQFAEAAAFAEQALAIDPSDHTALFVRFDAYRQLGDADRAAEAGKALKEAGGGVTAAKLLFNEAAEAYNSGNLTLAKSKFEQVIALDPELVPACVALGSLYLREGQDAAALKMAEEALARDPTNLRAMRIRYDAARASGDAEATRLALEALAAADPEWVSTGLYEQALERFNSDDAAGAKLLLEQVLESKPDHARAHYTMGLVLFNQGDVARGKEHLQRYLELAPDDADAGTARSILDSLT